MAGPSHDGFPRTQKRVVFLQIQEWLLKRSSEWDDRESAVDQILIVLGGQNELTYLRCKSQ